MEPEPESKPEPLLDSLLLQNWNKDRFRTGTGTRTRTRTRPRTGTITVIKTGTTAGLRIEPELEQELDLASKLNQNFRSRTGIKSGTIVELELVGNIESGSRKSVVIRQS